VIRQALSALADQVQLSLRKIEIQHDPAWSSWADEMRARVKDGSIWNQVAEEPSPEEIVEQWRRRSKAS